LWSESIYLRDAYFIHQGGYKMARWGILVEEKTGKRTTLGDGDILVFRRYPTLSTVCVIRRKINDRVVFQSPNGHQDDKTILRGIENLEQISDIADVLAGISGLLCGKAAIRDNKVEIMLYSKINSAYHSLNKS
jgi:hypothetical protein